MALIQFRLHDVNLSELIGSKPVFTSGLTDLIMSLICKRLTWRSAFLVC